MITFGDFDTETKHVFNTKKEALQKQNDLALKLPGIKTKIKRRKR